MSTRMSHTAASGRNFLPELNGVLYKFPNDAKLESLALLGKPVLADLAAREFRRLKPNWPEAVRTILDRCLYTVEG